MRQVIASDLEQSAQSWVRIASSFDNSGMYNEAETCDRVALDLSKMFSGLRKQDANNTEDITAEITPFRQPQPKDVALYDTKTQPSQKAQQPKKQPLYVPYSQRASIEAMMRDNPSVLAPYEIVYISKNQK